MTTIRSYNAARPQDLGAQALDAHTDPHLPDGVHFRVLSHPDLGLPLGQIEVFRMLVRGGARASHARRDIEWRDSHGQVLTVPFDMTTDNPVTGHLPAHIPGICAWIEVDIKATGLSIGPGTVGAELPPPPGRPSRPGAVLPLPGPALGTTGRARPPGVMQPPATPPASPPGLGRLSRIRLDAYQTTVSGRVLVGSRSARPLRMGATPIDLVVLTGTGRVEGARWLDVRALLAEAQRQNLAVWRTMALPVAGGEHYEGIVGAAAAARARLERCAPERFGLHDEPGKPEPASCSPAMPQDEVDRMEPFFSPLADFLQQLVDSDKPFEEVDSQPLIDADGVTQGSMEFHLMESVLQATVDPGVAQWIGLMDRDEAPPSRTKGDVVAYILAGRWSPRGPNIEQQRGVFLATAACATVGQPPRHPRAPEVGEPEPGHWLPTVTPPDAERRVVVPVRKLLDGGSVAFGRDDRDEVVSLHTIRNGRANVLVPGPTAADPNRYELFDRHGPPGEATYRVAQRDLFGRWGPWAERRLTAGERVTPPPPSLAATYRQPDAPEPLHDDPLSGVIVVRVPVPQPNALPPGGAPLAQLELTLDGDTTTTAIDADPMRVELAGPGLARAGEQEVEITGHFIDIDGRRSPQGGPILLLLRDPRPPPTLSIDPGLRYTSRPDATGLAMVRVSIPESPGQIAIRALYADEVRLRHSLVELAEDGSPRAQAAVTDLETASNAPERAAIYEREAEIFGRGLFELLGEPLRATSGTVLFEHALPGSLEVLSFYRFVAVGAAQVESAFAEAPLVPFAVVPTGTPRRPMIHVRPGPPDASGAFSATVVARVPDGNFPVTECRFLRTTEDAQEVERMLVVADVAVPTDTLEVSHTDEGGSTVAPTTRLWPFTRYVWRARVRTSEAAGGGPSAEWSAPSPPVATSFVPPSPPPAPTALTAERAGSDVVVSFEHIDARLKGGTMGHYFFEVHRQVRQDGAIVGTVTGRAEEEDGGRDAAGRFRVTDSAPPGGEATYRVTLLDPLGRRSPPAVFTLPASP